MINDRTMKDIENYSKISEIKSKCKNCGCTKLLSHQITKAICHNCGHYVFLNDQEEFKFRLLEAQKRNKRK